MERTVQGELGSGMFAEAVDLASMRESLCQFWAEMQEDLEEVHLMGGSGGHVAEREARVMDYVVDALFERTKREYEAEYGKWMHPVSLVGIGGYGRGELSPRSDVEVVFIYPKKIERRVLQRFLELYHVWVVETLRGLGVSIKSACRTVDETVEEAKWDFRAYNAEMDARLICGSKKLYGRFREAYREYEKEAPRDRYIECFLQEQERRHERYENTVFLVEPDVKNSKGGIRDYMTLLWVARAKLGIKGLEGLRKANYISKREFGEVSAGYDFLRRVRNDMHFCGGGNLLHMECQTEVAERLGYEGADIFRKVEGLMMDYYMHAKRISLISTRVIGRMMEGPKRAGGKRFLKDMLDTYRSGGQKEVDGFVLKKHVFTYTHDEVFIENPVRLIRIFRHCQQYGARPDERLVRLIRDSVHLITREVIEDEAANRCFRSILQSVGEVYPALSMMHELGVLGEFMPEFGKLEGMVPHDHYHRYTVDVHTLRGVKLLDEIFMSRAENPYLESVRATTRPSLVYLMVLLHDIGKADGGDDTGEVGAEFAKWVLDRMGIHSKQQDLVLFTIRNQMAMLWHWQRYDAGDPGGAEEFGNLLGDVELLHYMYVLTYCDAMATCGGLWNSHKEMLHRKLYEKVLVHFGNRRNSLEERKLRKKLIYGNLLRERDPDLSEERVEEAVNMHPERYFVLSTPEEMRVHLEMLGELQEHISQSDCSGSLMPVMHWEEDIDQCMTIVTVVTWDRTGLFYNLAGAFAASGLNVLSTKAITRADKITIDTFYVIEAPGGIGRRGTAQKRFEKHVREILVKDKDPMPEIEVQAKKQVRRMQVEGVNVEHRGSDVTKINVYHELSLKRTIVEIECRDKIGLLYQVAKAISDHGFDITFGKISTEHGMAMDTFHIQKNNLDERTDTTDLISLREHLNQVLMGMQDIIV